MNINQVCLHGTILYGCKSIWYYNRIKKQEKIKQNHRHGKQALNIMPYWFLLGGQLYEHIKISITALVALLVIWKNTQKENTYDCSHVHIHTLWTLFSHAQFMWENKDHYTNSLKN